MYLWLNSIDSHALSEYGFKPVEYKEKQMNLTEEQYEELKQVLEARHDYSIMIKEHNSAKAELMSNFLDELCPKPSGRMTQLDKERFKEEKKKTSQFLKDTERLYLRDINNEEDTTPEALAASERLSN